MTHLCFSLFLQISSHIVICYFKYYKVYNVLPADRISVHKRCLSFLMKVSLNIYTEEFEMFSNSARLCQHSKGEVEREETALRSGTASHGTHLQRLQRYCRIFLVPRIFSRIEFARHLSLWLPHLKPVVQKKKSQRWLYRKYAYVFILLWSWLRDLIYDAKGSFKIHNFRDKFAITLLRNYLNMKSRYSFQIFVKIF